MDAVQKSLYKNIRNTTECKVFKFLNNLIKKKALIIRDLAKRLQGVIPPPA